MKKRIFALVVGLWASLSFVSCGGYNTQKGPPSRLPNRVLASQGVTAGVSAFGELVIINGQNDTLPRLAPLSGGNSPGLMVLSPTRNIATTFDASSNTVFAIDTTRESGIGQGVRLPGPTKSIAIPSASPIGYAAVPTATINGFPFLGAVEVMNFSGSVLTTTIAVANANTVVANSNGSQLLVFSADSDSVTVIFPTLAVPPVDTSCYTNPPNVVCNIVQDASFSRPVNAIISGSTAYILNCGVQCGGTQQASVAVFDLGSLSVTQTIPVDAATMALLNGSTLYVAGTPANFPCPASQNTAAKLCGELDVIDLGSMQKTSSVAITDGYHTRMDMTSNGQIFIGSLDCTNIGNVNNPSGEVRGCLSIYRTSDGSVIFPPDNGDVNGLQSFTTRNVEYVAEGGLLRVYDTTKDILLIDDFLPQGTINIVGYVGDVKAIDFF
ncbi:MAG TPA: hypothetical protein VE377_01585 [Candidatus Dormibacteraeota bacterium]|nr:hypothetical protein [Candidatus Dormibacteraeota bacterium]